MMTWWQVDMGHATSQLVAQLSWQRLKCLQQATHVVYSTVAQLTKHDPGNKELTDSNMTASTLCE